MPAFQPDPAHAGRATGGGPSPKASASRLGTAPPKKKRGVSQRTLYRRKAAERAAQNAAANAVARAPLVTGEGAAIGLTPAGIELVEKLASEGSTQNFIASTLLLPRAAWRVLMGKPDQETEARMAFERGQARHEQDIINKLIKAGARWTPALVHYSKTKLGWKEAGTGAETQDDRRIHITLPAPMGYGEFMNALGQDQIIDARKDRSIPMHDLLPAEVRAALPAPTEPEPAPVDVIDAEVIEPAPAVSQPAPSEPPRVLTDWEIQELQENRTRAQMRAITEAKVPREGGV